MKIARVGLLLLLAGSMCPSLSSQSAEKTEARQQPQAAPKPKDESSSQKPAPEASKATGDVEILSDRMGFDFGPYLRRVTDAIRTNWYRFVPNSAKAPAMKRGKVAIEFAILKDGRIAGLQVVASSGDDALDRAAWAGISESSPCAPLPAEFRGKYLQLRFKFFYNPEKTEGAPEDKAVPAEKKP
jgi:TonB family protein